LKRSAKANFTHARPVPGGATQPLARAFAAVALGAVLVVLGAAREGISATVDPATLGACKSMEAKIQLLENKDAPPPYSAVVMTEREANSYLKVHSGEFLPAGVGTPSIGVQPEHAVASGDVDFDKLARLYPNPNDMGPKILAAMFHGTQHVMITANIQSQPNGVMVRIESVVVGGTVLPKWLVDYMLQNVLQPKYHFDLSKPFPYPAHVKRVVLGSGQTTVLRGP
jgi:hypothetical protein